MLLLYMNMFHHTFGPTIQPPSTPIVRSNPHVEFPMLIELYLAGKLDLDSLVTGNYRVNQSNEAFEVLAKGGAGRGLITFD